MKITMALILGVMLVAGVGMTMVYGANGQNGNEYAYNQEDGPLRDGSCLDTDSTALLGQNGNEYAYNQEDGPLRDGSCLDI